MTDNKPRSIKINNQAKVVLTSFMYFSLYANSCKKNNKEIQEDIKKLFERMITTVKMYKPLMFDVLEEVKIITKDFGEKDVNSILAAITLVIEYYEQIQGKKRLFTPMKLEKAVNMQCQILETDDSFAKDTFDYCSFIVSSLLKGNKS